MSWLQEPQRRRHFVTLVVFKTLLLEFPFLPQGTPQVLPSSGVATVAAGGHVTGQGCLTALACLGALGGPTDFDLGSFVWGVGYVSAGLFLKHHLLANFFSSSTTAWTCRMLETVHFTWDHDKKQASPDSSGSRAQHAWSLRSNQPFQFQCRRSFYSGQELINYTADEETCL